MSRCVVACLFALFTISSLSADERIEPAPPIAALTAMSASPCVAGCMVATACCCPEASTRDRLISNPYENVPVLCRPYRFGHVVGNTVRRRHRMGLPVRVDHCDTRVFGN